VKKWARDDESLYQLRELEGFDLDVLISAGVFLPIGEQMMGQINELVKGVDVDLDAPLSPADE